MSNPNDFLSIAVSQIGIKEQPANSNHTKYGEWYGLDYNPWCAMFVSWCADQAGCIDKTGRFAYCPSWVSWAKEQGLWLDREEKPQPGDIVFYSNASEPCHVGIVETRNGSESITAIEGNTSASSDDNGGAVMRRTRYYGTVGSNWYILGFLRPDWDGEGGCSDDGDNSQGSSQDSGYNDWIASLQAECNAQGYSSQTVDGIAGINTLNGCPQLGRKSQGNITRLVQERLIALGYSCGSCGADGENGADTQSAIRAFQRDNGLEDDGIVGRNTWRKLLGL